MHTAFVLHAQEISLLFIKGSSEILDTTRTTLELSCVRTGSSVNQVQWDQSSPGNSASHYSDQSMNKLDFCAA